MSDRLALANAIEDGGIERGKAERIASVIFDAIHDNVATKADVQASETALRLELAQLEHRLTRNGIGGLVVAVGIILTAMRFLGHG
ncbi:MAG: hypothetical protein ACHQ7M_15970 [Chloroflexota bacterium]|jgi:hypothetical protein